MSSTLPSYRPDMTKILSDRTLEDFKAYEETQYEEKIVHYLFSRYKLNRKIKFNMLREHEAEFAVKRLTLDDFHYKFPTFPTYLLARKFPKARANNPVHKFFNDFGGRDFTEFYMDVRDQVPADCHDSYGLIFSWPWLKGVDEQKDKKEVKGLVLHNRAVTDELPGARFHWTSPEGQHLVLEPLSLFLESIDHAAPGPQWHPDKE